MWTFVFIVAFCRDLVQSETLRKYEFHAYCDSVIEDNAGDLQFDAVDLPSYLPDNQCRVSIVPRHDSQIMFYFVEFEMSIHCKDTNLTVTHGQFNDETTVTGLPRFMCGRNGTLVQKGQNFVTSKDKLTITYRYSKYGKRFSGTFQIKFLQFHTGSCDDDNEYKCSNDHCINREYRCSDDIRSCAMDDDDCEIIGVNDTHAAEILLLGLIAGTAVVLYVLWQLFVRVVVPIRNSFRTGHRRERRNSQVENTSGDSPQMEIITTNNHSSPLVEPEQTVEDVFIASSDSISSPFAQPGDSPPSYEDTLAPSYDEVVANEHLFKTTGFKRT